MCGKSCQPPDVLFLKLILVLSRAVNFHLRCFPYISTIFMRMMSPSLSPYEVPLQTMLTALNEWCNNWRVTLNQDKTKTVKTVRKQSKRR